MQSTDHNVADIQADMIEDRKMHRLEENVRMWKDRRKEDYVSLSEIKD